MRQTADAGMPMAAESLLRRIATPFSPGLCRAAEPARSSSSSSSSSSISRFEDDDEDEDENDHDVSFLFLIRTQAGGPTEPRTGRADNVCDEA
jgi:hypothetical protein